MSCCDDDDDGGGIRGAGFWNFRVMTFCIPMDGTTVGVGIDRGRAGNHGPSIWIKYNSVSIVECGCTVCISDGINSSWSSTGSPIPGDGCAECNAIPEERTTNRPSDQVLRFWVFCLVYKHANCGCDNGGSCGCECIGIISWWVGGGAVVTPPIMVIGGCRCCCCIDAIAEMYVTSCCTADVEHSGCDTLNAWRLTAGTHTQHQHGSLLGWCWFHLVPHGRPCDIITYAKQFADDTFKSEYRTDILNLERWFVFVAWSAGATSICDVQPYHNTTGS